MNKRDLSRYVNQFVAFADSEGDSNVVAHGERIHHVYKAAIDKGFSEPVLSFVPPSDMICTY